LGTSAYATSKGAMIAMTKALAREFGKSNIRVNAVAPGLTMTPLAQRQLDTAAANTLDRIIGLTPLGRIGQPEQIAPLIAFLASDDAAYATGHVYNIDGGSAM
jgi:NAD(P)-dependent dehydrogenase (short-subunit alcohol dehydrogenase family)